MKIINLTPHAITLEERYWTEDCGVDYIDKSNWPVARESFPASGDVARVDMESTLVKKVHGFEVHTLSEVGHNLPTPQEGVMYLVSSMVLNAMKMYGRSDLIAPDTNRANRNESGHIVSVPGFVC